MDVFHLLLHSPHMCNSQGRFRLQTGAESCYCLPYERKGPKYSRCYLPPLSRCTSSHLVSGHSMAESLEESLISTQEP